MFVLIRVNDISLFLLYVNANPPAVFLIAGSYFRHPDVIFNQFSITSLMLRCKPLPDSGSLGCGCGFRFFSLAWFSVVVATPIR